MAMDHPLSPRAQQLLKEYNRRIASLFEATKRQGKRRSDTHAANARAAVQRAKYRSNAAQSPTPPPIASIDRDEKLLQILSYAEPELPRARPEILVPWLAEAVLFEQGQSETHHLSGPLRTDEDLERELDALAVQPAAVMMQKQIQARQRRLEYRWKLRKAAQARKSVRPYGWDKTTSLLKAAFYGWAMSQDSTATFTLLLSKDVQEAAKASQGTTASHLQERLQKLLRRRLPQSNVPFWFSIEHSAVSGFHLHGAIYWPNDLEVQRKVRSALLTLSGGQAPNQLDIPPHLSQSGWASYAGKHQLVTSMFLNGPTLTATRDVAQTAKALHRKFVEHYRAKAREAKRVR